MCVGLQTKTVYDDLPIHPEGTVVLNLNEDGLVYINGSGYGVEIERVGRDLRGAIGNRVYPEVTIQVDASPDAPAGSAEQLRDELRKVGLLKINRMRHE
jgi:biopolymer transport protein ExbD